VFLLLESHTSEQQFIEMGIGQEIYAISIHDVHEIIKIPAITPLPNSKPYLLGVINLRGKIVPVICLRQRFELANAAFTRTSRIVVVNHQEEIVGIAVDYVNQVTTFDEVQPPPDKLAKAEQAFFAGIGFSERGMVNIINLKQLFRD
jgi:purine-binding chemotaxis protein CheW